MFVNTKLATLTDSRLYIARTAIIRALNTRVSYCCKTSESTIMAERPSRVCRKLVKCGHCDEDVSRRTFYQHKRLYFDPKSRVWNRDKRVFHDSGSSISDPDFEHRSQGSNSVTMRTEPSLHQSDEMLLISDGKLSGYMTLVKNEATSRSPTRV